LPCAASQGVYASRCAASLVTAGCKPCWRQLQNNFDAVERSASKKAPMSVCR
jgi:hypothetical protein